MKMKFLDKLAKEWSESKKLKRQEIMKWSTKIGNTLLL